MIFITLGSQKFQFNRLLKKVDELIEVGIITEKVFAQTGASDYAPKNYEFKPFLNRDEFANMMDHCDVIITHGGTGTIIGAVKKGKKVIAIPRLARYGEHVDDHQLQLIAQFTEMNLICAFNDCKNLGEAIYSVRNSNYNPYVSNTEKILKSIDTYISDLK